jgi:cytochrome P450
LPKLTKGQDIKAQIEVIRKNRNSDMYKASDHETIYHDILDSDLPASEKTTSRLWQDGQVTVIAGTLTTASALSYALFCLLTQQDVLEKLKTELQNSIPNANRMPQLAALEQLPYLTACIKEALRLSNGVSTRLQRIDPENSVVFVDKLKHKDKSYVLPPGTPMSMTGMLIHWDESIYPDPLKFDPERWLNSSGLDKYLVPFSRGTRQCIGINLAYAEIYITLAMILRRYGSKDVRFEGDMGYLELFETEWAKDVEIVADGVTPLNRAGSKGVRIKVQR